MLEASSNEIVAREAQKEVDQDLVDQREINKRLSREIAIEKSAQRMKRVFDLVSAFMGNDKDRKATPVQHNGKEFWVEVSSFQKGNKKGSGYPIADTARVYVTEPKSKQIIHEIVISRQHDSEAYSAQYLDHNYPLAGKNKPDNYMWRKSDENKNPIFDAQAALDKLPEMREIEVFLEKAVEVSQQTEASLREVA